MDVIGNNVANINTVGFRSSVAKFADVYYNQIRGANKMVPEDTTVGIGSKVQGTQIQFAQGGLQATGVSSNVGINGNGFFITSGSSTTTASAYTREGSFVVDASGYLRTPDGNFVNGVGSFGSKASKSSFATPSGAVTNLAAVQIPQTMSDGSPVANYSIGNDGGITVSGSNGSSVVVGYLALGTFQNQNGLTQQGGTYFTPTAASGAVVNYIPGQGVAGSTSGGYVENSNVDLAQEFSNMIIDQQAYNANARALTVSNETLQTAIGLYR